jgi:uncharacterized protein
MDRFAKFLIKQRWAVIVLSALLVTIGFLTIPWTTVNYDLAEYLPEESPTTKAIQILEKEFSYTGMAEVMIENISVTEAVVLKEQLLEIDGIGHVFWLDDVVDITIPTEFIPAQVLENYYKDSAALFRIEFTESDYSLRTGTALEHVRTLLSGRNYYISGTASDSADVRGIVAKEVVGIMLIIFPICILILLFASTSWLEPILYLLVIGVSIIVNMGTNFLFNHVSFITHSMVAVLQLAISLDYSLFLFHRYIEEKDSGKSDIDAIASAVKQSFSTVSASAATTIAGFSALLLMSYRIGADIGIVLAKGILFSFVAVMILMPVMLYLFRNVIAKTRHKPWIPSFSGLSKFAVTYRKWILILGAGILVLSFMAQHNLSFLYGDASANPRHERSQTDRVIIADRFGVYNPLVLLVPRGDVSSEIKMVDEIASDPNIRGVQALVNTVDPFIPADFLPESIQKTFLSESFSRIFILLNTDQESPESYEAVSTVRDTASNFYPDEWYLAGKASSISDIRDSVELDSRWVMIASAVAILLIILISSKSLSIPVILVAAIQSSIWMNMAIPYFQGKSLVFIGYIIISSLQLGATIDYAILISGRYMESRRTLSPKPAAALAVSKAGPAVLVSALILTVAGLAEGILSEIPSVSEIGILLGRGAALSAVVVLFMLPGLLVLFDKIILKTTYSGKNSKKAALLKTKK